MKRILSGIRPWFWPRSTDYRYSKAYYHTRIFHKYDRLESYLSLYQKCREHGPSVTQEEISFLKTLEFGALMKEVTSALPSRYEVLSNKADRIKVIFYKLFIGKYRAKCYIHFFEDRMFLCSYVFSHLKEDEQESVMATLQKKYLPALATYSGGLISDANGNCIYVEKELELAVNYLSLNDGVNRSMKRYQEELQRKQHDELHAGEEDLFNRL